MKQSKGKPAVADRRSFLKLAGAGVVGTGAAAASAVVPAQAATQSDTNSSDGYRETDHVKRYYELAKFI